MGGAANHFGVVNDLVQRHGERRFVALDDHRQTIANQNRIDAGFVQHF